MEVLIEEGFGREVIEGTMTAAAVVECLEVVEEGGGSGLAGWERLVLWKDLVFDGSEGAFGECVIVAIAPCAHALDQTVVGQERADLAR